MAKKRYFKESELVFAEKSKIPGFQDLENMVFGRLTVLGFEGKNGKLKRWFCKCECGKIVSIISKNLKNGTTKSCGCLGRENQLASSIKHGHASNGISPTYHSWRSMIKRCKDPKNKDFEKYGGRGIEVCYRWLGNFNNFLEDMGERPKGKTLDRKNTNGNYEPSNCRWATWKEQSNNRRNSVLITFNGETKNQNDWAIGLNLNATTIARRIAMGWDMQKVLTTPSRSQKFYKNDS